MEYAVDTVTIVRHFTNTGKPGRRAKDILEDAENGKHHIFVSIISLVEVKGYETIESV
jgi:predicted nucleic acid-binding protein